MALFDKTAGEYDSFFETKQGKAILKIEADMIMKMIKPEPNLRVLDAGCGTGIFTEYLVSAGMDVTGFDESPEMLKIAERKETLKSVRLVRGDIFKIPFESASFDRVLCAYVIEFIKDVKPVVAELKRVLKSGGILVLATQNSKGSWAESRKGDEFWDNATFRTAEEIRNLGLEDAIINHCIHFPPTTKSLFGIKEWCGKISSKENGAVVVARWQK
jgi:ubiquinone/menaquinone biosynthesis C-methylase UbiE